ncbi:hypothetical protein LX36DRAFT_656429 [Colletotrichum falcatum]|nr:hypothetical protein LX36DRAFT_656429 [Colletotrichum falcatum]
MIGLGPQTQSLSCLLLLWHFALPTCSTVLEILLINSMKLLFENAPAVDHYLPLS